MSDIEKFPLESMNITEEQKQKLKQLFPEVFAEGNKIDWDKLRLTLGEIIDVGKERFGMNWPGKADCFKIIQQPSLAALVPVRDESVNFDTTGNLFIEGDNLEVLKLLQKSYLGKIKMIYIDPPYNTGNDFIYPDNYSESLETYLEYTGQVDSEGRKFSTNTDTEGRFHSKWMNMMYPRLFLAKNLLKEDGVIFISIDDNEVDNLKKICNELFGDENLVCQFVWQRGAGTQNDNKYIAISHEYILCYAKNLMECSFYNLPPTKEMLKNYNMEDQFVNSRGKYQLRNLNDFSTGDRPGLHYDIECPDGSILIGKENRWRCDKHRFKWRIENGRIVFKKNKDEKWEVYYKQYINEKKEQIILDDHNNLLSYGKIPDSLLIKVALTGDGAKDIKELFDEKRVFSYPKPKDLLKHLSTISTKNNDLILDFFAGSCSISQALFELNLEDNGKRKFICVQLPEPTDEKSEAFQAGYKTITDIGKERIRRVIKKIEEEQKQNADMFSGTKTQLDLGFKVFKLAPSNFSTWDANVDKTAEAISKQLELHINHISESSDQEAILYELLLKSGFELTTKIEKVELENKSVFSIGEGELLICLERELTNELIKAMAERKPIRVICLDEGFQNNDQLKTNAALIMKTKGVVKFQTV